MWSNSASVHTRDLIVLSNPMFLGAFSEAADGIEGQEQGGGTVGGHRKLYLWF